MAFAQTRHDLGLLVRIRLSEAWSSLGDPSDQGVANALDVKDRMALYRLLVEGCNPKGALGTRDELSPFWGYASQLNWQHQSGRLSPTGAASTAIDPASWWGACNFALCVVPYQAAAEEGAVARLRIDHDSFRPPNFDHALSLWREAMRALCALRPGESIEPARFAIWKAHLACIRTATGAHAPLFATMSRAERRLAEGWVRMVDFFCEAALRTDLVMLAEHGTGDLPARRLDQADEEGGASDFSAAERETLRRVFALADRPAWRWAIDLGAWTRIMRSRAARDDVVNILDAMFGRGLPSVPGRALALAYGALPVPFANALGAVLGRVR